MAVNEHQSKYKVANKFSSFFPLLPTKCYKYIKTNNYSTLKRKNIIKTSKRYAIAKVTALSMMTFVCKNEQKNFQKNIFDSEKYYI